jgi:hypothetical protein
MDNILDAYVKTCPTHQNAIDLFKNEWSSKIPGDYQSGSIPLFGDTRIAWAQQQLGGFVGAKALELGPLEGGHSYMLEKMGAASVLAIESNSRAYVKCLISKEILAMQRVKFMLGDFVCYLKETEEKFDVCIASGVLYHMQKPSELLGLMAAHSDKIMLWTHYYDEALIKKNRHIKKGKFGEAEEMEYQGFKHTVYRQNYHEALEIDGFCGGPESYSNWMLRDDIPACLEHFGFKDIRIDIEKTDHPNGPCYCVAAMK